MDPVEKLEKIMEEHGNLTEYSLAKDSGIPQSTLSSIFRHRSKVSLPTLEDLCHYFNITLSQFFFDPEKETLYPVTAAQQEMLEKWLALTPRQKEAVMEIIGCMNERNKGE